MRPLWTQRGVVRADAAALYAAIIARVFALGARWAD